MNACVKKMPDEPQCAMPDTAGPIEIFGETRPNGHHTFSPSKLERIENCPPSWKLCRDFRQEDGNDAARGTLLHRAFHDDAVLAELSEADRKLIGELRGEYVELFLKRGMKVHYELFVTVRDEDGRELTGGTLDILVLSQDETVAQVIDLKFGGYEVTEAKENLQMIAYVAGVFQKFQKVKTCFSLIAQPVFGIGNYDRQAKTERGELPAMLDRIRRAEEAAEKADPADLSLYRPTAGNCRYCNKLACPQYRKWMRTNMEIIGVEELPREVAEMTVDYADRVKCAGKAIVEEMKGMIDLADRVILDNGGSANYRVCAGRNTRKIDWKELCRKHGITDEEIAEFTTESVGNPYLTTRMRKNNRLLK